MSENANSRSPTYPEAITKKGGGIEKGDDSEEDRKWLDLTGWSKVEKRRGGCWDYKKWGNGCNTGGVPR